MRVVRRILSVAPCPSCGRSRVWSHASNAWECRECDWSDAKRIREQAIITASVQRRWDADR